VLRPSFRGYLAVVQAGGVGVAVAATMRDLPLRVGPRPVVDLCLAGLLVAAELWPFPVPRGEETTDEITLSSTFGLALMLLAPLWLVIAVQGCALVADSLVRRRNWDKLSFNISQYALAYAGADLVYALLVGPSRTWAGGSPHLHDLAALVAGIAFFVCNNGFIAGVLALRSGRTVWNQFREDARWQTFTAIPATALAPVVAELVTGNPWLLVLLLTPLIAVHHSGELASRREFEALHDPLTGLGNRTMLFAAIDRALEADDNARHAVLLVDLDHFKDVNDTLGHHVGDGLLQGAANVLSSLAPPDSVVTRLGGDEFAFLLRRTDDAAADALAAAVVRALRQPCVVEGMALRVRGSVGVALFPRDGVTRQDLLRRADVALYKAKEVRDGHVGYQPVQDRSALNQLNLVNDLSALLDDPAAVADQLQAVFQPEVGAGGGELVAVECLVRWQHPRLGLLMPADFLGLAEYAGLMSGLGAHVLELAVAQQRGWANEGVDVRVAVNFSMQQLADTHLPESVAAMLARYGVPPSRLVVEVTESVFMADPDRSAEILHRLRASGAHISLDDYGSGYSSLAYLKRLEVDELKIDRQYIEGITQDKANRIIVRSTIDLAHQLGLRVVAEGIEDPATATLLAGMGCDLLQGYLVGRPMSPAAVAQFAGFHLTATDPQHPLPLLRAVPAGGAG
jgi:diguanylate cyclase (GGDEF)-like protein